MHPVNIAATDFFAALAHDTRLRCLVLLLCNPERWVDEYVWKIRMGEVARPEQGSSLGGRHRFALGEVREIVGRIW